QREHARKLRAVQEKAFALAVEETVKYLRSRAGELGKTFMDGLFEGKSSAEQFAAQKRVLAERMLRQRAEHEQAMAKARLFADGRRDGFESWFATGEAFAEPGAATAV